MQLTPEIQATIREALQERSQQVRMALRGYTATSDGLRAKWERRVSDIDAALTWIDTLAAGEVDANGLLPCPFCGTSEVRVEQDESETWWWINCDKCDITIEPFVTKGIAIAMWNRRTPAPQPLQYWDENRVIERFHQLAIERDGGVSVNVDDAIDVAMKILQDAPQPTQEDSNAA